MAESQACPLFGDSTVVQHCSNEWMCDQFAVKLGPMLVHTGMDDESIALLQTHFHDFLRYVVHISMQLTSIV